MCRHLKDKLLSKENYVLLLKKTSIFRCIKKQEGEDRSCDAFLRVGAVHKGGYCKCWVLYNIYIYAPEECGIANFGAKNSVRIYCKKHCCVKSLFKMGCSFLTGMIYV